jgi:putative ABC transport system permease protein
MFRRKVRSSLTIFGIVIGVFALTVMGSMSEYFNNLVSDAEQYARTHIQIRRKQTFYATFNDTIVRQLRSVRGVKYVITTLEAPLEEGLGGAQMSVPDMFIGTALDQPSRELAPNLEIAKGRSLQKGDTYHAVVGYAIAEKKKLDLGSTLKIRKKNFTVVGIFKRTGGVVDQFAIIPLPQAQSLLNSPGLITTVAVIPEKPEMAERVAERINREVPDVKATPPKETIEQTRQAMAVFNVIMLSGALLALIVGGLSVINTMVMAVSERTREIGIKKAVGASDGDILAEYMGEAAIMGLLGGLLGLSLGALTVLALNQVTLGTGLAIFSITPRLVAFNLLFATGLGTVAGLYPAWRASRLDTVQALRSE